jgi:hypothetical protein
MNARLHVSLLTTFAVAAALGAGFAALGPVPLIRILGTIALVAGAAGCALQLYALRQFAPRAYALLHRKCLAAVERTTDTVRGAQRTLLAGYR